jgi:hypothetical protein
MLLVFVKFLVPLGLLLLGYGSEVPLPAWMIRQLSPRAVIFLGLLLGPVLFLTIPAVAWLLLRKK